MHHKKMCMGSGLDEMPLNDTRENIPYLREGAAFRCRKDTGFSVVYRVIPAFFW